MNPFNDPSDNWVWALLIGVPCLIGIAIGLWVGWNIWG